MTLVMDPAAQGRGIGLAIVEQLSWGGGLIQRVGPRRRYATARWSYLFRLNKRPPPPPQGKRPRRGLRRGLETISLSDLSDLVPADSWVEDWVLKGIA